MASLLARGRQPADDWQAQLDFHELFYKEYTALGLPGDPRALLTPEPDAESVVVNSSAGTRETIELEFGGAAFTMDVYAWGAAEASATHRILGVHGNSPTKSRERWHSLGARFAADR